MSVAVLSSLGCRKLRFSGFGFRMTAELWFTSRCGLALVALAMAYTIIAWLTVRFRRRPVAELIDICLAENRRRMSPYDRRLLRPFAVPALAGLARRFMDPKSKRHKIASIA